MIWRSRWVGRVKTTKCNRVFTGMTNRGPAFAAKELCLWTVTAQKIWETVDLILLCKSTGVNWLEGDKAFLYGFLIRTGCWVYPIRGFQVQRVCTGPTAAIEKEVNSANFNKKSTVTGERSLKENSYNELLQIGRENINVFQNKEAQFSLTSERNVIE